MENSNLLRRRMLLLRDFVRGHDIIPNVCIYSASEQAVWRRGALHGMAYLSSDLEFRRGGGGCFCLLSMIM